MIIVSALQRVLGYLKGIVNYGIHYVGHPRVLEGYSDTNWVSNADEIYSTSGYYVYTWRTTNEI